MIVNRAISAARPLLPLLRKSPRTRAMARRLAFHLLKRRVTELDATRTVWVAPQQLDFGGAAPQNRISTDGSAYEGDSLPVRIARDGAVSVEGQSDRDAIATLLSASRVPIRVTARHPEWVQFRDDILWYAVDHLDRVYQPLLHPDLQSIPSRYGHHRYELVRSNLPNAGGTLLDIGAHWGYFCQQFSRDGFDCTAVESDEKAAYFLEKLRVAGGQRIAVVNQSILDYRDRREFDVVLAFNIFHHFLKTEASYEKLKALLGRLKVGVMILQTYQVDSAQMAGAFREYDPDSFASWVAARSGLRQVTRLGETEDGRPVYRLDDAA